MAYDMTFEMNAGNIIQFVFIVMDVYFMIGCCWTAAQIKVFYWVIEQLFLLAFILCMLASNFYIFPFCRFFGFAFRYFGRSIYYFIVGSFLGKTMHGYCLANFIIAYILAVACLVMEFVLKERPSPPLFQRMTMPSLYGQASDYYELSAPQEAGSPLNATLTNGASSNFVPMGYQPPVQPAMAPYAGQSPPPQMGPMYAQPQYTPPPPMIPSPDQQSPKPLATNAQFVDPCEGGAPGEPKAPSHMEV